jgi:predicted HNH restriction endonuclease
LTYERLGQELIGDVVIICRNCHDKIHLRDAQSRARYYRPGYHQH